MLISILEKQAILVKQGLSNYIGRSVETISVSGEPAQFITFCKSFKNWAQDHQQCTAWRKGEEYLAPKLSTLHKLFVDWDNFVWVCLPSRWGHFLVPQLWRWLHPPSNENICHTIQTEVSTYKNLMRQPSSRLPSGATRTCAVHILWVYIYISRKERSAQHSLSNVMHWVYVRDKLGLSLHRVNTILNVSIL